MTPLRVALNAQLRPGGHAGGIEQFVVSLVRALGRLDDGDEEYLVVGPAEEAEWLTPHLGANERLVAARKQRARTGRARRLLRRGPARDVDDSGGFFESLGAHVVHFPYQAFARCAVPALYNPHDLQHLHFPEFFGREQLAYRRRTYRAACLLADAIACESRFTADDVLRRYAVDPARLHVVRRGAPEEGLGPLARERLDDVRRRLDLPDDFALFPSQTWPHKNHLGLARALRLIRDRGEAAPVVVCTGRTNEFFETVRHELRALGVEDRMRFLGYVNALDLRALYRLSRFVVLPTLFEGGGFPILEAFRDGVPVACSDIEPLREYAGEAALFFDPRSEEDVARALVALASDGALRRELAAKGAERGRAFSWDRAARTYRALYRRLAGRATAADDALVAATAVV